MCLSSRVIINARYGVSILLQGVGGLAPPPQASCYDRATTPANILVLTCRSADLPTHPIIILYNVYVGPY